jgi:hypothetical protein
MYWLEEQPIIDDDDETANEGDGVEENETE